MQTREGNILSFLGQMGRFQEEYLQQDLMNIRVLYYDQGYLDISVGDPIVELSRDRTRAFVAVSVDEGDAYTVSSVSVSGDLLESQEDTMDRLVVEPGETFRSSQHPHGHRPADAALPGPRIRLREREPLTDMNPEADEVGITYDVDRGELAYIGRIRVLGNDATRDRVIRREMAIREGDQYSRTLIRRSESWVQQLGFFESVQVREMAFELGSNRIDLEVEVGAPHTLSCRWGRLPRRRRASFCDRAGAGEQPSRSRSEPLTGMRCSARSGRCSRVGASSSRTLRPNVSPAGRVQPPAGLPRLRGDSPRRKRQLRLPPFRQHEYSAWPVVARGLPDPGCPREPLRGFDTADTDGVVRRAPSPMVSARPPRRPPRDHVRLLRGHRQRGRRRRLRVRQRVLQGAGLRARLHAHRRARVRRRGTNARTSSTRRALCRWLRAWVLKANFELGYVGSLNPRRACRASSASTPAGPRVCAGSSCSPSGQRSSRRSPATRTRC